MTNVQKRVRMKQILQSGKKKVFMNFSTVETTAFTFFSLLWNMCNAEKPNKKEQNNNITKAAVNTSLAASKWVWRLCVSFDRAREAAGLLYVRSVIGGAGEVCHWLWCIWIWNSSHIFLSVRPFAIFKCVFVLIEIFCEFSGIFHDKNYVSRQIWTLGGFLILK